MAVKTWTLTDVQSGFDQPEFVVGGTDVPGTPSGWFVRKQTLRGGLSDGVEVVEVNNGNMLLTVLPTRGMGIWKARVDQTELGWQSPVRGPVHPKFVPLSDPSGLGWLDGFDELLVRCGLESNGAPDFDPQGRLRYALHGRIANRPAHRVAVHVDPDQQQIQVVGEVEESRFLFYRVRLKSTVTTQFGSTSFQVCDEVENLSDQPTTVQLLYHINFGSPLLEEGARVVAPAKTVVPRNDRAAEGIDSWDVFGPPQPGFVEQVYFFELLADAENRTRVLLKNRQATQGVCLEFSPLQLPCFTLWKNTAGPADGYVTGLEPATNFPNPRSFEERHGRVVSLEPHQSCRFELRLDWLLSGTEVEKAEQRVLELAAGQKPTVHKTPLPDWCAG